MKKFLALMLVFSLFFAFGCKEDEKKVNEFETLVNYLESQPGESGQWVNTLSGWILNYGDIQANLANYFILDLRKATDFGTMALPNAVNSTLPEIFDKVAGTTKPVLVVCYSGQTASYAHTLLRMKGIEAYVLKFGMSIVDKSLDKWTSNCSSDYVGHANWVKTASDPLPKFDYPKLDTGEKDAEAIMDKQIDAALGVWGTRLVPAATVMAAPGNYNIMNYWAENDYLNLGHVKGSYQLSPKTLTKAANLSVFDPDGGNVLYCWTGQTAAATISYLYVLGYDVQSIAFGVNSMIWSELTSHKWDINKWN